MNEPDYYAKNGLSPIGAMKQGLISKEQYKGFLIGNVIKYVVRAGHKENAIEDLEKAKNYIDFYLELLHEEVFQKQCITHTPDILLNVNNDIDFEKLKKDITEALEEANNIPEIIEEPTDDPNIMRLNLSDIFYDEDGELTPEAREKVKKYLIEIRNEEC